MTEVFRPSQGELVTRSALGEGYPAPVDSFKKPTSRPSTQGGYRFGQLSQNSFFTRHNPHPSRVRHLKGLLDVPICAVNDDGYFANPRYSLQFPPSAFNQKKLANQRIPINAINVNSQLHPINTITGLNYFTGLTNYPFRERAVPRVGLVPVTEAWRDELKALTDAVKDFQPEPPKEKKELERPKTQYSETTGRLIPPPSRAMSRGASRQGSRQGSRQSQRGLNMERNFQHIAEDPDMESAVLMMLCQILQTEDINAVKAWLCSAGEREKTMVLDMIRSAVSNKEDYFQRDYKPEFIEDNVTKLPPINEKDDGKPKTINRLTMDESGTEKIESWKQMPGTWNQQGSTTMQPPTDEARPQTSDAFRPSSRPRSQQVGRVPTANANKPATPLAPIQAPAPPQAPEAVLRLTKSAQGSRTPVVPVAPAAEQPIVDAEAQDVSPNTF